MAKNIIVALAILLFPLSNTFAATFTVNSTQDVSDATPGNGVCDIGGGLCTLRAAIDEANATAAADTILLPAGRFPIGIVGDGEDANATGDFDILKPVTIRGVGADSTLTIIDGRSLDRVFHVQMNQNFTLEDLTVTKGFASGDLGGGIYHLGGAATLEVSNCGFELNTAQSVGGAIAAIDAVLNVSDSLFERNSGFSAAGAIYSGGTKKLTVTGSEFTKNTGVTAGAIFYGGSEEVSVTNSVFDDNTGISAAGCIYITTNKNINISTSSFNKCKANSAAGAIFANTSGSSSMTFDAVTVTDSIAGLAGTGGGIFATNDTGPINVLNSTFENNSAMSGGGVQLNNNTGGISLKNTNFLGNSAAGPGGAGTINTSGNVTLSQVTASDNTGFSAGGGFFINAGAINSITDSKFNRNYAFAGIGGAIYSASNDLIVTDSIFEQNIVDAGTGGGGLFASIGSNVSLNRTLFSENYATGDTGNGGGVFLTTSTGSILNSTFSGNFAGSRGGAFLSVGNISYRNNTFYKNTAPVDGAAVYHPSGTPNFANTIIAGNAGSNNCVGGPFASSGTNIDDDLSCGFAGPGDQNGVDPKLAPLADNGGFSMTHALLPGSPAIDRGGNTLCQSVDQRKASRPFDGDQNGIANCDIGAFESQDACPSDANKTVPGACGCGTPDADANANGILDCFVNDEMSDRAADLQASVAALKKLGDGAKRKKKKKNKALKDQARADLTALGDYNATNGTSILVTNSTKSLQELVDAANKLVTKALRTKHPKFKQRKKKALKAIAELEAAV
ncbi:MAG: choice-of-anchor Q domain-containing protein [Bdellovibrionota bacterium]